MSYLAIILFIQNRFDMCSRWLNKPPFLIALDMIIKILPTWWPYDAFTISPFIFAKRKQLSIRLRNHEFIHMRQQGEMTLLIFLTWYLIEFIVRLIQYRNWQKAYLNISFEREAYRFDENYRYLSFRKSWHFLKFLKQSRKA